MSSAKVQPNNTGKQAPVYREEGFSMSYRRLGLIDGGREVGALGHLFSSVDAPLKWQTRAILEKLLGLIRARKTRPTTLIFSSETERFLMAAVAFSFGTGKNIDLRIIRPKNVDPLEDHGNKLYEDLNAVVYSWDAMPLTSVVMDSLHPESFELFVLAAGSVMDQSLVLKRFVSGQQGVMIVRDFSFSNTKFRADDYRDAGLVVTETADGYGECWSLPR
jgi:hypothetical protein